MNIFSLFTFAVFAFEAILSPIPDDGIVVPTPASLPDVSFGQLIHYAPPAVLGVTTENPSPTPFPHKKDRYSVAVLGDSMVDTLGPGVPHLQAELVKRYPDVLFTIINFGVGGENIDSGIFRLINDYDYLGNHLYSIQSFNPDLLIVESFAYNPYPVVDGVTRHWLALARVVDTVRATMPNTSILFVATIAPNATIFGDNVLHWSSAEKQRKVAEIKEYLENTIRFARGEGYPIADAFHPSLGSDGNGKIEYIHPGDQIHYSDAGREFFGKVVADSIVSNKLLE